ncbi:MAG TPA: LCP family protein [Actinospica sp.]|nr:LCP family protein [Actinospica sp.]
MTPTRRPRPTPKQPPAPPPAGRGRPVPPSGRTPRPAASSPFARLRLPRGMRIGLRALAGTLAFLVLAVAATGWYMDRAILGTLTTSDALNGLGDHPETDQNILLMGLDSRKDMNGNDLPYNILDKLHAGSSSDIGGYNTNTLILLHVPADGSRAVALSIPRDDYVNLPEGLGPHKIKEAYGRAKALAEQQAQQGGVNDQAQLERIGREAGRKAAIEAVQDLLGIQVDHFAEINLAGFYDLANALGGVTVCLRQPAHDDYSGANFPAGVQTLNGQQALEFVRQRHNLTGGDLDRTHRQQAFLASAAAKLNSAGVFGDLSKLGALLDVAHRDVVVDSGFNPLTFIRQAGAVTSGKVSFYTLPIEGFATEDGESVNLIDPAKVRADAQQLIAGKIPAGMSGTGAIPQVPQGATGTESAYGDAESLTEESAKPHAASTKTTAAPHHTAKPAPAKPAAAAPPAPTTSSAPVAFNPPPGVPCVD